MRSKLLMLVLIWELVSVAALRGDPLTQFPFAQRFEVSLSTLAGQAFSTGPVRGAGAYTVYRAEVETDIAGTLAVQTSTTSNTAFFLDFATVGVSSGAPTSLEIDLTAPYVRSIFRNGATAQTRFYHRDIIQLWP